MKLGAILVFRLLFQYSVNELMSEAKCRYYGAGGLRAYNTLVPVV